MNNLEPHQQRMVVELKELEIKIVSLRDFISNNPIYLNLPTEEKEDLYHQLYYMEGYSDKLNSRINRFKSE